MWLYKSKFSITAVTESQIDDVDKVLLHVEAKEFTIEPSALQSLQQLIQWVADLALSLLARLPHGVRPSGVSPIGEMLNMSNSLSLNIYVKFLLDDFPCIKYLILLQYDLLRDYKALNTLRELLVIIRIWGLLRKTCLPVFVRCSDSLDILAHIFKLLTRLVQSSEPDETLIGMGAYIIVS